MELVAPPATQPAAQQPPVAAAPPQAIPPSINSMRNDRGSPGLLLHYENTDLYDVVQQVAEELGLAPLIIDPEVKGSVVMNSGTIQKEDIMPLFNIILKNNSAALVKQGGVYQIVPISVALKKGLDIIEELPLTFTPSG